MTDIHDIAVVGGGIVGASLLHFLHGARSVILLEQEAAVGYHSTGRSAAEYIRRFHWEPIGRLTSAAPMMSPPTGFSDVELLRSRGNLIVADAEKTDRLTALFHQERAAGSAGETP